MQYTVLHSAHDKLFTRYKSLYGINIVKEVKCNKSNNIRFTGTFTRAVMDCTVLIF